MEQVLFECKDDSIECHELLVRMCDNSTLDMADIEALDFYPYQLVLIILYSITSFLAVGSNLLTIVILLRREHNSTELWKYLINLSVADISMATFCIPFTYTVYMLGRWIFPHFLCRIIYFVQTTSVTVSIWTLTAIGIDRYFAILYPFRSILWIKKYKYTTILFIWLSGAVIALPLLLYTRIIEFCHQGELKHTCREDFSEQGARLYTLSLLLVTFIGPLVALSFVYVRICLHLLHNSNVPGNPDRVRDKVNVNKKMKVIKMLFTIVIVFAVCWIPIHIFQLCVWFYPDFQRTDPTSYLPYVAGYFACHWLAMSHAFANPFIYCFMSDNFRQSLRVIYQRFTKGAADEHERRSRADIALTTQSVVFTEGRISTMNKKTSLRTAVLANHNANYNNNQQHPQSDHAPIDDTDETAAIIPTAATSLSEENALYRDEFV